MAHVYRPRASRSPFQTMETTKPRKHRPRSRPTPSGRHTMITDNDIFGIFEPLSRHAQLTTKQLVAISAPQSEYVETLAVSATGWVVYAGFGKMLRLWNPQTGQQRSLPAALPTSNLILGPDGTSIIFGTADGGIEHWDTQTGQRLSVMTIPGP